MRYAGRDIFLMGEDVPMKVREKKTKQLLLEGVNVTENR